MSVEPEPKFQAPAMQSRLGSGSTPLPQRQPAP